MEQPQAITWTNCIQSREWKQWQLGRPFHPDLWKENYLSLHRTSVGIWFGLCASNTGYFCWSTLLKYNLRYLYFIWVILFYTDLFLVEIILFFHLIPFIDEYSSLQFKIHNNRLSIWLHNTVCCWRLNTFFLLWILVVSICSTKENLWHDRIQMFFKIFKISEKIPINEKFVSDPC